MRNYATVTLEQPADHVALVTMIQREKIICLSEQLLTDLWDALHRLEENDGIRALIITGTGKVFCAGADLKLLQRVSPEEARKYLGKVINLYSYLDSFPKPTVAAINGFALGGGMGMILAMDFRLVSEAATMGLPESTLGILPGAGGVQKLTHFVGRGKALEITLLGEQLSPAQPSQLNLVFKVCPPRELLEHSVSLANRLAKMSPHALRSIKSLVQQAATSGLEGLDSLALETMVSSFNTKELEEGLAAFFSK